MLSHLAISQPKTTSPIEGEYMEVRLVQNQGFSYRLAPGLPFQKVGVFHRHLKPYLKQYDESFQYKKKYNRSVLGIAGGATLYTIGTTTLLVGSLTNNANVFRAGGFAIISGLGLSIWSNHVNSTSIYKAVDAYNRNKNPNVKDVDYMEVTAHPITTWQFRTSPSEDYKTVGLYGRKLKPYLEENEAAYNAYKKYRVGNVAYSLGNIVGLTGTGMSLGGIISNNSDITRVGLGASVVGVVAIFIGKNAMNKNIYQAVDLMNYQKLPTLNSSFIPSIQPSSHSAGLGLVWSIE